MINQKIKLRLPKKNQRMITK